MKRIYLFCDNGMSTSMMAQRMQEVADKHNLPFECKAFSYKKNLFYHRRKQIRLHFDRSTDKVLV